MKKLLRPKDILFLGLAGIGDFFEEVAGGCGLSSWCYREVYGFVPSRFRKTNFTRLVARNLKTGDLEKIVKNGEIYLRLTSQGQNKIRRDFPVFSFSKKSWDGKWRIVTFDIAELDRYLRESLREKLRDLGFGMLQKSVWLTPHDILADFQEFLENKGLSSYVYIMETGSLLTGDEKALAGKIWNMETLNEKYIKLLEKIDLLQRPGVFSSDRRQLLQANVTKEMRETQQKETKTTEVRTLKAESERTEKWRYGERTREIKTEYANLLLSDPCLPKELLPDDWAGETVRGKIRELKSDKIN